MVWLALKDLPPEQRQKTVHVISTDTLVAQPVVAAWVDASHAKMRKAAAEQGLPVTPHKLTADVHDSFWVNLIGKGYPAPRHTFRWCTSRMKINPSNNFIRNVVRDNGEALLVLGTRKAESQRRGGTMQGHEDWSRKNAVMNERLTVKCKPPEFLRLYANRRLDERRCLVVPHAGQKPVGAHKQIASGNVPRGIC